MIHYRNISCSEMTEDEIEKCAKLFSENYGIWSKAVADPSKIGKRILLSPGRLRAMFVEKPDRYVALIYDDDIIIGQAFYLRRKITSFKRHKNKYITWVLQLVVKEEYRGNKYGSKLLHAIWGLSDNFAWGIYTSNPRTIKALENATLRKIYKDKIIKHFPEIRSIAYDLLPDQHWLDTMHDCCIDTGFPVDHSKISKRIKDEYPAGGFPFPQLNDSEEWLAFVFRSQKPQLDGIKQLNIITETSKDILRQAYENMDRASHTWASHTKHEIDYILQKGYVKQNDKILDLGCGNGRHTIEFGRRGFEITGVDFSQKLITQNKFPITSIPHISVEIKDVIDYIPEKQYDVVLCLYDVLGSYSSWDDNVKIVNNIAKSLSGGGIAIISVMNLACTLSLMPKSNIIDDIKTKFTRLIKLPSSQTMQQTGDIFNGKLLLFDKKTKIIYHKEQFWIGDLLPKEFIIPDRRFYKEDLLELFDLFFEPVCLTYVQAGHWDIPLEMDDSRAKEIFAVFRKRTKINYFLNRLRRMKNGLY